MFFYRNDTWLFFLYLGITKQQVKVNPFNPTDNNFTILVCFKTHKIITLKHLTNNTACFCDNYFLATTTISHRPMNQLR